MHVILAFLMLSLTALAQHSEQPQKESNADLRSATLLFSVEDVKGEKLIWLERTPHLDHFLRLRDLDDDDEEVLRKVDSKDAKKLEMEFASRFLKCQYEIPASEGECKALYKLNLKGEPQEICKKDEKKTQEIETFFQSLHKRF